LQRAHDLGAVRPNILNGGREEDGGEHDHADPNGPEHDVGEAEDDEEHIHVARLLRWRYVMVIVTTA
jgi:hypothetical protein